MRVHATPVDRDVAFLSEAVTMRCAAGEVYFDLVAEGIASCAAALADRFFAGATLLVFGSGAGVTDAQHNAVEYVHPVLPGCRALPALALGNHGSDALDEYAHQVRVLGRPSDIALAFLDGSDGAREGAVVRGLDAARQTGMLTVALSAGPAGPAPAADHVFHVAGDDTLVAQELHLATYHMLWELTHIVLNHRGIAEARR